MQVNLPSFFTDYDGVEYYYQVQQSVLSEQEYDALPPIEQDTCVRIRRDVDVEHILTLKPFRRRPETKYRAGETIIAVKEVSEITPRTDEEIQQFMADYKHMLVKFVMEQGVPLYHFNPYFKVYKAGDVYEFNIADLTELGIYKYGLATTGQSANDMYVKGLLSSDLVVPVLKNKTWTVVSLAEMAAMFFEEYVKKVREYLDVRNELIKTIYAYDLISANKRDGNRVMNIWRLVFGTDKIYGKINVFKLK